VLQHVRRQLRVLQQLGVASVSFASPRRPHTHPILLLCHLSNCCRCSLMYTPCAPAPGIDCPVGWNYDILTCTLQSHEPMICRLTAVVALLLQMVRRPLRSAARPVPSKRCVCAPFALALSLPAHRFSSSACAALNCGSVSRVLVCRARGASAPSSTSFRRTITSTTSSGSAPSAATIRPAPPAKVRFALFAMCL
jgi:hypothetical protein